MIGEINLFYIFITAHLNKHIHFFYIYFFIETLTKDNHNDMFFV
jgi:hypothetical protein